MTQIAPRPDLAPLVTVLGGPDATRIVGGAVRDAILGLSVSDTDLATLFEPDDVLDRLAQAGIRAVPTGKAHGTITAVLDTSAIEVTTLRRDVTTDGRRATVAYTTDWHADAARRDFTINALYADSATGTVYDYCGGLADLAASKIRFIGDPLQRIAEDHLRILRFFRFYARFGRDNPDAAALAACTARAKDIMALSRERIASELLKLLGAADPRRAVALMLECGIFEAFMPEVRDANGLDDLVDRERDAAVDPDPIRRLAALIGPVPDTARVVAKRLRLSNALARRLIAASGWSEAERSVSVCAMAYRIGADAAVDRLLLSGAPDERIATVQTWQRPTFPLSGGNLVARGFAPGPRIAAMLSTIEQQWVEAGFPDQDADEFADIVERVLAEAQ